MKKVIKRINERGAASVFIGSTSSTGSVTVGWVVMAIEDNYRDIQIKVYPTIIKDNVEYMSRDAVCIHTYDDYISGDMIDDYLTSDLIDAISTGTISEELPTKRAEIISYIIDGFNVFEADEHHITCPVKNKDPEVIEWDGYFIEYNEKGGYLSIHSRNSTYFINGHSEMNETMNDSVYVPYLTPSGIGILIDVTLRSVEWDYYSSSYRLANLFNLG